jgi:phosphate butyryltransferase
MIKTFEDLLNRVKRDKPLTIALAVAQDHSLLRAVDDAFRNGIAKAVLVGDKKAIEAIAEEVGMESGAFEIIDIEDKEKACLKAVEIVHEGKADLLMKGFVDTSSVLRAVLNKKAGLSLGGLLSHVGVLKSPYYDRFFIISDSAMTIFPSLNDKVDIINNAVHVAHALGNANPKVAVLCAVEKVNDKMPSTIDAERLTRMNEQGKITGCTVKGPLGLDNAVSPEAARHKGIVHPVAGHADILIVPDLEVGNVLNKAMEYFGKAEKSGVIMGAERPIILTSRASSKTAKLNSIALSALIANQKPR